jgi:hypothetical protein
MWKLPCSFWVCERPTKIPAPMIDRDVRDSTKFDRNFERVKFNSLLARQPERISNRLEHSPLMVSSQNVIPLPNG